MVRANLHAQVADVSLPKLQHVQKLDAVASDLVKQSDAIVAHNLGDVILRLVP
jgi:hypothetical protein